MAKIQHSSYRGHQGGLLLWYVIALERVLGPGSRTWKYEKRGDVLQYIHTDGVDAIPLLLYVEHPTAELTIPRIHTYRVDDAICEGFRECYCTEVCRTNGNTVINNHSPKLSLTFSAMKDARARFYSRAGSY